MDGQTETCDDTIRDDRKDAEGCDEEEGLGVVAKMNGPNFPNKGSQIIYFIAR